MIQLGGGANFFGETFVDGLGHSGMNQGFECQFPLEHYMLYQPDHTHTALAERTEQAILAVHQHARCQSTGCFRLFHGGLGNVEVGA